MKLFYLIFTDESLRAQTKTLLFSKVKRIAFVKVEYFRVRGSGNAKLKTTQEILGSTVTIPGGAGWQCSLRAIECNCLPFVSG